MRGIPTELATLRGTARRDRIRPMPRVKQALGSAPEDVPARMKAIWEELRDSAPDGLLGEIDRPLVEVYCTVALLREELTEKLHKNGRPAAERARLLTQLAAVARLLIKLSSALLISPEARARVTIPAPAPSTRNDEWKEVAR